MPEWTNINGNGATLKFYGKGECILVDGNPIKDVTIKNLRIVGSKYDYFDKTEYWHGITIYYANNICLYNVVVEACRGDGIYIGGSQPEGGDTRVPMDISLINVRSLRNHRQGLSITRCNRVFAENCEFAATSGTLPYCGVDIEPNGDVEHNWINECHNICFLRCHFSDNDNPGLMICGREMSSDMLQNQICNVSVIDCSFVNNGICVYGVNGLKIVGCSLHNGGILMTAYGRIQNVSIEDVRVCFDKENNSCGFQLVLLEQNCRNFSLDHFRTSNCGIFGIYVTRGRLDAIGKPFHQLNGLFLSNILVENCCNSVFVSEYVSNAVYNNIVIKRNGIDRNGQKMNSRYGSNLEFIQLDDEPSRIVL